MAEIVKFTAGLEADLLKKSGTSYVNALDTGHLYFVTKEDEEGNVFGSIYYDKGENNEKDRVFMGGAITQRAIGDETGKSIAEYYVTRISSSADAVDTKLTTYNGLGASLATITLPKASATQAGIVDALNQTFAGVKTFNSGIAFPNSDSSITPGLKWVAGTNDGARIVAGATAQNAGYLEIAVKDDGNEPIYVRQYTGDFANVARTLTLLNANGNTVFPGTLLPIGTKAQDLGSESLYWKTAYIDTVNANELTGHLTGSLNGPVVGNATSADKWYTARKFTIGSTTKDVDGTTDMSWSRTEIGCSKHFTSFKTSATSAFGWYTIAKIDDQSTSPAMFFVRAYAHTSLIFTATKGWSTNGAINIIEYSGSRNDDYAYVNGVRILSDGTIQIRIRSKKGSNSAQDTSVNLSINCINSRDNLTLSDSLVVDTTASPTVIQSRELSAESGIMAANKFYGYLSGTANMAENDAGGASIIPKYITRIDYDSTTDITKSWIRTYDGNNTKKAEVEMPIASTTSNGLVNRDAQTFAGKKTFNDQVIFAYASDAAKDTASTGNIIIGDPVKQHIAIDDNEIMAKTADGKTVSTLYLNNEGGPVQVGGNLNPNAHNSLTLGLTGTRWANMFGVLGTFLNLDVEDTLYVNKNNVGTAGGISLRGAEGPMTSGIALRTTATPGTHGYVTGSWATYLTSKAGFGWIFRDSDNSKNIASLSTGGRLVLNDVAQTPGIGASQSYIAYPSGGTYACNTEKVTGYLKITLPQSWTNTMMRFKVSIFNYKTGTSVEYLVGGYNYSPSTDWHQEFAQCIGKWEHPALSNLKVRFGHDGTKCAIYIGESNTQWTYPQVTISDVTVGYSNYDYNRWASGWAVGFTTSLGVITKTVENTNIAYRAYHADRATEDESGSNIKANYLTVLRQYESTGTTFKFVGVNKNGADMLGLENSGLISVPEATTSIAGLVTTNAQSWAGTKTFRDNIVISHATTSTVTPGSTNPHIRFEEYNGVQPVYLMYNDHDVYRSPAGLKVVGDASKSSSKAWFEVEGDLIIGAKSILNGDVAVKGNIMPQTDNTYVIGDVNTKWKDVYSDVSHVYKTIYVNSSGVTSEGGIGLYSVNSPESYGIAIRNNLSTHGYVTTPLSMFFSMSNANTAGWIFRFNGTNVASINGQGYAQFNKINMNRSGGINNGRIGWYNKDFYTWYTYMSDRSSAGSAPTGGLPSLLGSVTTWAMRSLIENVNNYGWIWESCANTANATPVARMALSSTDGKLYLKNDINIITGDSDKFIHYVYKTKNNDGFTVDSSVNTVGASWRAGVTHSTADNEYVIQSGSAAETGADWLNGMKIAQGTLNATFGTSNLGGLGVANTNSTTGHGISLYGGGVSGRPTYGLFFGGTGTFGKHGYVQGDWATYFTMHQTANRGWIFMKVGDANVPVASINVDGKANFGETYIRGPLKIGDNANGDTNYIAFYGTTGDNPGSFNHAYIGENLYSSTECSELVIYKGNDIAPTASPSSPGPDRIRHIAAAHLFQIYKSALNGTWTDICDSTVPVNVFEINQSGVIVTGNENVSGTLNVDGAVTFGSTLDVTGVTKLKQGSAATAINTGALQVTGGLSTTAASYINGGLTVANGNISIPTDNIIQWSRNTDLAKIGFKNDSDGDTDSYLYFHTADNGNEHFKFRVQSGSTITDIFTLKNAAATFNGTVTATTFVGALNGNAASATKWQTARTFKIADGAKVIDGTSDITWTPFEMRLARARYNVDRNMNQIANHGIELGMADLNSGNATIDPNGQTSWHHYINITWSDCADNNGTTNNQWTTQIANKCGTTDLWVRSRNGGSIADGTAWAAPWVRILTATNFTSVIDGTYVNVSGDSMNGRLSVCAQDTGTTPGGATIELREYNRGGSGITHDAANAPRLGFHWGNRYWAQFSLFDNALRLYNSDFSGYYPFVAGALTADRGTFGGYSNTSYAISTASFISQSWIRTKGTTGWYGEDYGCHVRPHDGSYGSIRVHGNARNSYEGIHIGTSTNGMTVMSIAGSHQGLYTESVGRWIIYHNAANGLVGIGDSTTNGSYRVTVSGGTYNNGHLLMNGQIRLRINGGSWYNPIVAPADGGIWYDASSSTSSTYWSMLALKFSTTTFSVGGERAGNVFGIYSYSNSRTTNGYDGGLYVNGNNHYFYCTTRLYGAVWNDYAEYRETKKEIEPGRVVIETGLGDLVLSSERLQPGANITSDTYGFAIGETEKAKTPIAVSGRALVFPYEDKATYAPGDAVCTGPNGTVSKMSREEIMMYPERIVGTVSEIPNYDPWGQEKVKVNGRIWIKVR